MKRAQATTLPPTPLQAQTTVAFKVPPPFHKRTDIRKSRTVHCRFVLTWYTPSSQSTFAFSFIIFSTARFFTMRHSRIDPTNSSKNELQVFLSSLLPAESQACFLHVSYRTLAAGFWKRPFRIFFFSCTQACRKAEQTSSLYSQDLDPDSFSEPNILFELVGSAKTYVPTTSFIPAGDDPDGVGDRASAMESCVCVCVWTKVRFRMYEYTPGIHGEVMKGRQSRHKKGNKSGRPKQAPPSCCQANYFEPD